MLKFIGLGIFFAMLCLIAGDAFYQYMSRHQQLDVTKASLSSLSYKSSTEKGKLFEELKYYYDLSEKLNLTSESLEAASKLVHGQTLSPEESLVACDLIFKIRMESETRNLEPELLNQNRLATIELMERLLKEAKDSKFIREEIDIYDCRMYLSKLLYEESQTPNNAKSDEQREKSLMWKRIAKNDPKQILKKFKGQNDIGLPGF